MSTDHPSPPDPATPPTNPTSRPKLSSAVKGFVKFLIGSEESQKSSEISEQTFDIQPTVPTVPLRSPPYAPTVGKFINLLAAWVGNVLFWLSVIIAAGWLIVGLSIASIDRGQPTLGAFGIVFVVAIIIVGIGWGLRYFFTR